MNDSQIMAYNQSNVAFSIKNFSNISYPKDDPKANLYSRLEDMNLFRNKRDSGKFMFGLVYPELELSPFLWKQRENPFEVTSTYIFPGFCCYTNLAFCT